MAEKKKGFFVRLVEKLEKKMKKQADKKCCCANQDIPKEKTCCK